MSKMTYTETRWSLADLYPSQEEPDLEAAFEELEAEITEFEALRPSLTPEITASDFREVISKLESHSRQAYRLSGFAGLRFREDTQDQNALTFLTRVQQFIAELHNRILFFELWWKGLEDNHAQRLMDATGDYAYWLEVMRQFKPHTLTEPEEKVINIKNVTGPQALRRLYETITNRYSYKLEVDGEVKELTRDALAVYVRHPDADLRARAYQELYRVFGEDGPILGQVYQTLVRDWRNEQVDLRHFASPIAVRNLSNDIPDEVVDTLFEVTRRNVHLFQRYFRLKARWLGMDRLRRYDIYAPVVRSEKTYSFAAAAQMVLESFENFDPQLALLAQRVFDESHMDSEVRKGKASGAFCWTVLPDITPWVLLNYNGRADDVAAMAHELGHAIHSMVAADHSLFTFHASLPLAETASTFAEMLLVDRLLEQETDEAVRRDILFRQVDDSYATIMRQIFFALFERQAHDMTREGAAVDQLSEAYLQNLRDQFGDSLELTDEFRWEWVSIWHMYGVPFYVYAYAFGQLLVLSLYQQYKAEGEAFKPRYLEILTAGGSDAPERILARAGVDIRSSAFWQGGFDVIEDLIEQLEAIPMVS